MLPNDTNFSTLVIVEYVTSAAIYHNVTLQSTEVLIAASLGGNASLLVSGAVLPVKPGFVCASTSGLISAQQPLPSPFIDKSFSPLFPATANESSRHHTASMYRDWLSGYAFPITMPMFTPLEMFFANITWVEYLQNNYFYEFQPNWRNIWVGPLVPAAELSPETFGSPTLVTISLHNATGMIQYNPYCTTYCVMYLHGLRFSDPIVSSEVEVQSPLGNNTVRTAIPLWWFHFPRDGSVTFANLVHVTIDLPLADFGALYALAVIGGPSALENARQAIYPDWKALQSPALDRILEFSVARFVAMVIIQHVMIDIPLLPYLIIMRALPFFLCL